MSLEVVDLAVAGPQGRIVHGVTFAASSGAPLTLIGETGSGKSLVAAAVMGNLPPELSASGRVILDGIDLMRLDAKQRRALWGRRIALLPQEPWVALDPTMPAIGQVEEVFALVRGHDRARARAGATRALAALGLGEAGQHYPFQLSGGMAQRAAIAAIAAAEATLLLADEPTKGLDAGRRDDLAAALRARSAVSALLTITHDIVLARQIGGTIAVMLDGRVVEQGPAAELLAAPRHDYTRRLIAADPANWPAPSPPPPAGQAVVEARGISHGFGNARLFRDLDIAVPAGQVVAVTGPSGCGKTTLGNLLLGLLTPDAGTIRRADGPRHSFQKLYQDPPAAFAPQLSLRLALLDLARRHGIAWPDVASLLARLSLPPGLLDRLPGQISGGELQRFALARVLLLQPLFLFADEATSRLDPLTQHEIMLLLREQVETARTALLLVTHDDALARAMASTTLALAAP
jgi:peptide/nickel transport system ATP-binding protein